MYKLIRNCGMPSWLKVLINILLTITVVYWLGYFIYKFLEIFRKFLHTMTKPDVYWIALGIILLAALTTVFILEFCTDIKPFTNLWNWIVSIYDNTRDAIANKIHS